MKARDKIKGQLEDRFENEIRGINSTISISNTKKIIVNRKNRIEKGIRADLIGSNPHSKGESLSRSIDDRCDSVKAAIRTTRGTIVDKSMT